MLLSEKCLLMSNILLYVHCTSLVNVKRMCNRVMCCETTAVNSGLLSYIVQNHVFVPTLNSQVIADDMFSNSGDSYGARNLS